MANPPHPQPPPVPQHTPAIKAAILKLAADPVTAQALIDAGKEKRGSQLTHHSLKSFDRKEVAQVLRQILASVPDKPTTSPAARPVEWVAAVATLVAGALAA